MCKSSERRKRRRAERLARLARRDYPEFSRRLSAYLDGVVGEISRRAKELRDDDGNPMPPAYECVYEVCDAIAACGPRAVRQYYAETRGLLEHHYGGELARAMDRRMYVLSNMTKSGLGGCWIYGRKEVRDREQLT